MDEKENAQTNAQDNAPMISDGSLGIFTVVALVLLLWGYLWFKGTGALVHAQTINVIFHEVAQLNDNAAVYVDGIRVGMIDKMDWEDDHKVLVRVRITNKKVHVPQGAEFMILTNGIVGAKYIEIKIPRIPYRNAGLPDLPDNAVVRGEDPGRPELAINKLVIALSQIDPVLLVKHFNEDRKRLVRAADQLSILADKTYPVIDNALPLERDMTSIAHDLKTTTRKINKILDDPHFSNDLKETVTKLKETAETIKDTVRDINNTLTDKPLRRDLLSALDNLRLATENVQHSVASVEKMTGDQKLRDDIKDILAQARKTLDKVDSMFSKPGYGSDLKQTLSSTREAIGHLDMVSQQLNQILDKRAPLLHLMFGRPGQLKELVQPQEKDKTKAEKKKLKEKEEKKQDKKEQAEKEKSEKLEKQNSATGKKASSGNSAKPEPSLPQQAPDLVMPLDALHSRPLLQPQTAP